MMVKPTERHKIVGISRTTVFPMDNMVNLQPIATVAAGRYAPTVASDHGSAQTRWNLGRTASDVEGHPRFGQANGLNRAGTQQFVQGVRTNRWATGNVSIRTEASVDKHRDPTLRPGLNFFATAR